MLNILLTGFYGRLTTEKMGLMTKCSIDTALRDIKNLIDKAMLKKYDASGAVPLMDCICNKNYGICAAQRIEN